METNYEIKDRVLKAICELYLFKKLMKGRKIPFSASNLLHNET